MATWVEWVDTGLQETKNVLNLRNQVTQLDQNTNGIAPVPTPSLVADSSFTTYLPYIGFGILAWILLKGKK
jgi:hypothetical protein